MPEAQGEQKEVLRVNAREQLLSWIDDYRKQIPDIEEKKLQQLVDVRKLIADSDRLTEFSLTGPEKKQAVKMILSDADPTEILSKIENLKIKES